MLLLAQMFCEITKELAYLRHVLRSLWDLRWPLAYDDWAEELACRQRLAIEEARDDGWECACGRWQADDGPVLSGVEGHCDFCGRRPPWGCRCSFCQADDEPWG